MKWQKYFSSQILERGYDYFKDNRIEIINASNESIDANVDGYRQYNLRISFNNNDIRSMFCNCPFEGNCKHLAAVLYYADEHPEIFTQNGDIHDIIDSVSYDDLKEFLVIELSNDKDLYNRFKLYSKSEIDDEFYINKLYKSFSNPYNVIKFIDDDFELLIQAKKYDLVLNQSKLIIKYLEELYDEHDWNSFDYILNKMDTIMIRLFNLGAEDEVLEFLADIILNNENIDILEMLTDTYSRIGDVEKLFEENYQKVI